MSKRQRITDEQKLHAVTKGNSQPRKLPDVVKIRESQATALAVLLPEQQRLLAELAKINKRIDNVLAEFNGDYGLSAQDMNRYQLVGDNEIVLVKGRPTPDAPEAKAEAPIEQ